MTELIEKLNKIPDAYDDFISGVINYAERKSEHVDLLNRYLNRNQNVTSSDVVEFIIKQPDFHSYSAVSQKRVG